MAKKTYYMIISTIILTIMIVMIIFLTHSNVTKKELSVFLIVKSNQTNFEFWQTVKNGAKEAAKEFNINLTVDGPDNEEDIAGQIKIVKQAIAKKPDVIILAATNQTALVPYAKQIKKKGIKLILVDSALDEDVESCFVGTNNVYAAQHVGQKMCESLKGKGKVVGITHKMTTTTAIERVSGFSKAFSGYPGIEVLEMCDAGDSTQKSKELALALLKKYPDLDGIFATNQVSAEGVTQALEESGKAGKVVYYAIDSSSVQNEALENGTVYGFAVQKPFNMGYLAVQAAMRVQGYTLKETNIDTGFAFVTRENMHKEEIQKLIYPFI